MYVPFESLPTDSRIWIYQSNRKFSDDEMNEIETALQAFLVNWSAHGTSLESSYKLRYNRFIILAVNHSMFLNTDVTKLARERSVYFDIKAVIDRKKTDARL